MKKNLVQAFTERRQLRQDCCPLALVASADMREVGYLTLGEIYLKEMFSPKGAFQNSDNRFNEPWRPGSLVFEKQNALDTSACRTWWPLFVLFLFFFLSKCGPKMHQVLCSAHQADF